MSIRTWTQVAPMPAVRYYARATALDGKIHVTGGYQSNYTATHWVYDPSTNAWTTTKASLLEGRYGHCLEAVAGKLHCFGGIGFNNVLSSHEVYDPLTDTWSYRKPLPTALHLPASAVLDGVLYCIGGTTNGSTSGAVNHVYAYDPVADVWTSKQGLPQARLASCAAAGDDGLIYYVAGIMSTGTYTTTLYIYDPLTDIWNTGVNMPDPARGYNQGIFAPDGRFYSVCGNMSINPYRLRDVDSYDPITDTWRSEPDTIEARHAVAVAFADSHLYAFGGYDTGSTILASAEKLGPFNLPPTKPTNVLVNSPALANSTADASWQHNDPEGDPQEAWKYRLRKV